MVEDIWNDVFLFCSGIEMCAFACVSKSFNMLSERSGVWEQLCFNLWKNKQNHPFERWVTLIPTFSMINESRRLFEFIGINPEDVLEDDETEHDFFQNLFELNNSADNSRESSSLFEVPFVTASSDYNYVSESTLFQRKYAPLSRGLLHYRILVEGNLLKRLQKKYDELKDLSCLVIAILSLFTMDLRLKEYEMFMRDFGLLLTWKESCRVSIEDSKRERITYEELREQGDWLIMFEEESIEMCRFVTAGRQFIDDRAFRNQCCNIFLKNSSLLFVDIMQIGSLFRTMDWGWQILLESDLVLLASFDRVLGVNSYSGRLAELMRADLRGVHLPESLLFLEPLYGTYRV